MSARLSTSIVVGGLLRRAEAEGGFGVVLAKGDATSGAVIVVLAERGGRAQTLERILQPGGGYAWQDTGGQAIASDEEFAKFLFRRRQFDPDLWLIELDVPNHERFAAEMNAAN
jgi:hypothetical protein